MIQTKNKTVGIWLFIVCFFIAVLVIFGGFVRLTRSGLSMVEWNVVTGVVPPLNEAAWQETFELYQQSPEYQQINTGMSLAEYKFIYYMEYLHRLLGRLAGLVLVGPLLIFLINRTIPPRQAPLYLGLALLFGSQGVMGWYMVKSGLVDQPYVSHYRLTAHLLLALILFAGCFWLALRHTLDTGTLKQTLRQTFQRTMPLNLSLILLAVVIVQIAYGGFVAGLKAGHISDTFPSMFGYILPPGLLALYQPWPLNLVANPITVHFIHRWLAFGVLALAGALYYVIRAGNHPRLLRQSTLALLGLVGFQILLGVGVILWHVPLSLALIHQAIGLATFAATLFVNYQLINAPHLFSDVIDRPATSLGNLAPSERYRGYAVERQTHPE